MRVENTSLEESLVAEVYPSGIAVFTGMTEDLAATMAMTFPTANFFLVSVTTDFEEK